MIVEKRASRAPRQSSPAGKEFTRFLLVPSKLGPSLEDDEGHRLVIALAMKFEMAALSAGEIGVPPAW